MPSAKVPGERLPVDDVLEAVDSALASSNRAVLQAAPGAGKSTHAPLFLMHARWLEGRIIMLEPRRLAARSVARRMATLLGDEIGRVVGYRMRGETRVSSGTRIEVVTEGVLTRMLLHDPALEGYGLVIFDEFHERSIQDDAG